MQEKVLKRPLVTRVHCFSKPNKTLLKVGKAPSKGLRMSTTQQPKKQQIYGRTFRRKQAKRQKKQVTFSLREEMK